MDNVKAMKFARDAIISHGHQITKPWAEFERELRKMEYDLDYAELRRLWRKHVPLRKRTRPFGMATLRSLRR